MVVPLSDDTVARINNALGNLGAGIEITNALTATINSQLPDNTVAGVVVLAGASGALAADENFSFYVDSGLYVYSPQAAGGKSTIILGSQAFGKTYISLQTSADAGGHVEFQVTSASGVAAGNLALNPNGGNVGVNTASPATALDIYSGLITYSASSTTAKRIQSQFEPYWADATDATRKGGWKLNVWDTAAREALRAESAGGSAALSFFGSAVVGQQATTGTTTGFTAGAGTAVQDVSTFTGNSGTKAYTIGDIVLALKNYGLLAAS